MSLPAGAAHGAPGAPGPLEGVRVLDLTSVVMGPYATQWLGDLGADVVKIEPPEGDVMRLSGPMKSARMGHFFLTTNRNKRSVVIDLKQSAGRELLLDLVKTADVLVYNIRPRAMQRLGLGYEVLSGVNPRLIVVGGIGFGQRGPYAAKAAYEVAFGNAWRVVLASMVALWRQHPALRRAAVAQGLLAVGFSAFWSTLSARISQRSVRMAV